MSSEKDNILELNQCTNNPEYFSTTKIAQHAPFGYSTSAIWVFG